MIKRPEQIGNAVKTGWLQLREKNAGLRGPKARQIAAACLVIAATFTGAASAQQAVGSAVVNGRAVTLFSNGTWSFREDAVGAECARIAERTASCGDRSVWRRQNPASQAIAAQYQFTGTQYAPSLVEGIGTEMGTSLDLMREAAIGFAANGMGVRASEVPILALFESEVEGLAGETIVYSGNFRGIEIVMANTILIDPDQTWQLQSYVLGTQQFTEDHRAFHDAFLAEIEITP